MKLIPLTQGLFAKVDDEDYEYLNQFKWMATKVRTTFYAIRNVQINGKWKHLSMHREIMQTPDDMETDHKDWDGCNNQRHNMRNCTHAQNMQNQKKRRGIYSSKFIGVTWHKQKGKWQASIRIEGKLKFLGLFNLETDAALAYNKAAKELHGEFTVLNPILIKIRL